MQYNEVISSLQNLTNTPRIKQAEIAKILGISKQAITNRIRRGIDFSINDLEILSKHYKVDLVNKSEQNIDSIPITYRPDVYLSAGYGVEVYDESSEKILIDSRLLISERGNKINPDNCEVVRVSGNSMSPEYRHGDRVIIDKGGTELYDGHIYAFRYKDRCYVKELNLLGDKIKCISLNKEYDPFYIKEGEPFVILGRIIPRVRL